MKIERLAKIVGVRLLIVVAIAAILFDFAWMTGCPVVYSVDINYQPGVVCPNPPAGAVPPGFTVVTETCGVTR